MNAQTESWTLQGPAGAIQAACDRPAGTAPARGVAILSHPHPLFGGTMDNKVVQTLARAFVQSGWTAVRWSNLAVVRRTKWRPWCAVSCRR